MRGLFSADTNEPKSAPGSLVLAGFAAYERGRTRRGAGRLIDTALFRQRPFTLGLLASLVFFTGIPSFFMILLITLQGALGYSPLKAGAVTLGFALALAIGSARSAAAARRLGSRVLVVGCLLMLTGQSSVIAVMYWQGTNVAGWHLLLPLFVAGIGGGFFLARSPTSSWPASPPRTPVPRPGRSPPPSRSAPLSASPPSA
jgi:Na+/melibiose symporter-like transporter